MPALVAAGCAAKSPFRNTLIILSLFSTLFVCRLFPFDILSHFKPFNFLMPIYAAPCLLLYLCLLGGLGLQRIFDFSRRGKLIFALMALLTAIVPFVVRLSKINTGAWQFEAVPPKIFASDANVELVIAFVAALLLAFASRKMRFSQRLLACAFLVLLNLGSIAGSFRQALPTMASFTFPDTDVISFLKTHEGRSLSVGNHMLLANTNDVYGLSDFRVINPFLPSRYYQFMLNSGGVRQGLSVFVWGAWNIGPEIDLASVKYIVVQEPHAALPESRFDLLKSFGGGMQIYLNKLALPEAYVAYSAVKSSCASESLKLIREKSFRPDKDVVAEFPEALSLPKQDATEITPADEVRRVNTQKIVVHLNAAHDGIAVLTDAFYPGWTATLDGKNATIFPVNGMFRGVKVEAGKHELVYEYRCDAYENGKRLFLAGILILLLYIGVDQFRKSSRSRG
jgi:hypothetical protein